MTLEGEKQLMARLNAIGHTEVLMRQITIQGVREAKLLVPRRTGNLGRTIRPGTSSALRAEIRAGGQRNVGYARAIELGRGPLTIRPKPGRRSRTGREPWLAWGGPRTLGGRLRVKGGVQAKPTTFAREVHQPARQPHPYLRPGLQKAVDTAGIPGIVQLWNGAA